MKKLLFLTVLPALLCAQAGAARAQVAPPPAVTPPPAAAAQPESSAKTTSAFDSELEAFKKTIARNKAGTAVPAEAPEEAALRDALKDPLAAEAPGDPAANPLGLAATLPVKGAPATANALATASPSALKAQMKAEMSDQEKEVARRTFEAAIKQLMPMSPDQIRELYGRFETSRKAAETPIRIPEVKMQTQTVSLDPTEAPPVVHLTPGYVTTLNVVDSSGAPWPIQDLTFAGQFDITPPETGGNIIRIVPLSAHGVGNMSVRLVDLTTPVIFNLSSSLDAVDYRFDVRMTKKGPLAKTPIIEFGGVSTVAGTDENLIAVLDGAVPAGAEKLDVKGVDGRTSAWRVDGRVYLRTPLTLLSPAWELSVASSDGTTVYSLNDTPVILLSDDGRMVRARVADAD